MRLHRLEVTAFGPFADTVRIDFDALSSAGLFLLSGQTGAGKSSVLDAVSFALYGDVPGDRGTAKRLRCDQAPEGLAPRVVLEATLSGRRFRLDRSPAWQRPKKRGTGTTTEQARVVVSEQVDGAWQPLSTRLDEAGHLVTRLVGMTLPQFCQVAMLPQGRFQAFLRARSEERHALLQQVFRTGRFDQVERWLRDRRTAVRRESEACRDEVSDLVSRFSEVSGSPAPADWSDAAEPGDVVRDWTLTALDVVGDAVTRAEGRAARATAADAEARAALDEALTTARLLARLADARAEADALAADEQAHDDRLARLDAARRAAPVRPLLTLVDSTRARDDSARATLRTAREEVHAFLPDTDVPAEAERPALEAARREVLRHLADVARVQPLAVRATALGDEVTRLGRAVADVQDRQAGLAARAAQVPVRLEGLRERVGAASRAVLMRDAARQSLDDLRAREAARDLAHALAGEVEAARAEHTSAVAHVQAAREHWLDVRERRLEGMAAEIASGLAVGACCPVCGSHEHPAPAAASPGAPDAAAEKSARRTVDDLEVVAQAHDELVRELETRLAVARSDAGDDTETLPARIVELTGSLARLDADAEALTGLEAELADLEATRDRLDDERAAAAAALADLQGRLARVEAQRADALGQVTEVLDGSGHDELDALADELRVTERAVDRALAALSAAEQAARNLEEALARAADAAHAAGFDDTDAADRAWLDDAALTRLAEQVDTHRLALDRVCRELADPELVAVAGQPQPDLGALRARQEATAAGLAEALTAHAACRDQQGRLLGLQAELTTALDAWAPVRAELALTASMAALVEGRSADNRLQMRLSAYVLAHRLSQVVAAANLRLARMSDQRYSLEHTGRRGAGETRGGLSLLVRDDWSGETRDPATLSGGETFVVSLALALGLADVITQEAGGADLDTLFVDEGFGSLDADTLDDVLDTLDELRDGGRVVGVVSHVAEMQTRIPTQLRVHKGRAGSRVSQHAG